MGNRFMPGNGSNKLVDGWRTRLGRCWWEESTNGGRRWPEQRRWRRRIWGKKRLGFGGEAGGAIKARRRRIGAQNQRMAGGDGDGRRAVIRALPTGAE